MNWGFRLKAFGLGSDSQSSRSQWKLVVAEPGRYDNPQTLFYDDHTRAENACSRVEKECGVRTRIHLERIEDQSASA